MLPPPAGSRQASYAYTLPVTLPRSSSTYSNSGQARRPPIPDYDYSTAEAGPSRQPSRTVDLRSGAGFASGLEPPNSGTRSLSYAHSKKSRLSLDDEEAEDQELQREMGEMEDEEEERGLEETLEKIGFGSYHWRLLALCGFGWMSDNSALQCIAVILPRVQIHFNLSNQLVGLLSASTMAGMMIGAVSWGVISDLLGRALPFNLTLFLTAVFGIGASFSPSFPILCVWMFFLGSAVGGSMPTDGTLFLENLPYSKQYLLTLLSVFFSLGAVLSSTVSYFFLPGSSCKEFDGCDIAGKANDGWRRVLFVLGLFNLVCSLMRWFLFRLQESPRYLVSRGRQQDALVALKAIATYNDHEMEISHADVDADYDAEPSAESNRPRQERDKKNSEVPSPDGERSPLPVSVESGSPTLIRPTSATSYNSVGIGLPLPPRQTPIRLGSAFYTQSPRRGLDGTEQNAFEASFASLRRRSSEEAERLMSGSGGGGETGPPSGQNKEREIMEEEENASGGLRNWRGLDVGSWWRTWVVQMSKLFVPQWRRTVILMWIIWGSMSFAYTMFNVWLPAVLENRASGEGDEAIKQALSEFVLYSLAGCPGSIIGAWMIQTSLGRRKSLAICTLATGISTFAFISVEADWAVVVSSMIISMAATAMYAVLYGMTPETFGTTIRGTACGTSAALSRLTGVMAPVTAGVLLTITPHLPVMTSAAIFVITAMCSLLLPFERVAEGKGRGMISAGH